MPSPLPKTEATPSSHPRTTSSAPVNRSERTQCKVINFAMKWTIQNFQLHKDFKASLYNTGVSMAELGLKDHAGRWRICVCPSRSKNDTMSVRLTFTDGSENDGMETPGLDARDISAVARVRLTIGHPGNEVTLLKNVIIQETFTRKNPWAGLHVITYASLFGSGGEPGQLQGGCVTISMQIKLALHEDITDLTGNGQREFLQRQLIWADSGHEHDSDFVLRSMEGKEFYTNPFLLAAQSPVLAAMLMHDTKEKRSMCCEMQDVDEETVEILLDYLYGGETGKVNGQNAEKVLVMADKYQLMHLRSISERIIARSITMENAVCSLRFANLHKLDGLKEASLEVIVRNMGKILSDKDLVKSDAEMMQIIVVHCMERARQAVKSYEF